MKRTQQTPKRVAYFCMEVGVDDNLPTYAGGLGILAGDTLRAAADQHVPMVGITLLHKKGYFKQRLDKSGKQTAQNERWSPAERLEPVSERAELKLGRRRLQLRAWRLLLRGASGHRVPVYFLDTDLPANSDADRRLTDHLYGGDKDYRLRQEMVLGLGGVALLRALGHEQIQSFHMNEGHAALLTLALLREELDRGGRSKPTAVDLGAVQKRCVFTTHTPVPAGHDSFSMSRVRRVLGERWTSLLTASGHRSGERLNMTELALRFARTVNGVAWRHGQVSAEMFPSHSIDAITNGVHAGSWAAPAMARLFDRQLRGWRRDNHNLRHAVALPLEKIQKAHLQAKRALLQEVKQRAGLSLSADVLTLGFARRATAYKRADLLLSDTERLERIARDNGGLQIIYAGKAHPRDTDGQAGIQRVFQAARRLGKTVPVVYLENYDRRLGRLLCAGVDVWVNTPIKPQEASGTSGMKAALNGVPSLSVLDGWWIEGHVEGVTGWSIGDNWEEESDPAEEADSLYYKLGHEIAPLYYGSPRAWARIMRFAMALNGSWFTAQRMIQQYVDRSYGRG